MAPVPATPACCARLLAVLLGCLLGAAGCRLPAPVRPSEPIHAGDDYLRKTQASTFKEFLVGPANLRETGVPPTFQEVADKSTRKFVRGVANVATGWVEIPKQIYNTWYQERTLASPMIGLGKGVGMAVSREVVGVFEMALPISPAPTDWEPIISPEFVFEPEMPRSALEPARPKRTPWWRRSKPDDQEQSTPAAEAPPAPER